MATQIAAPRAKPIPDPAPVANATLGHNKPPLDAEAAFEMKEKLNARRFGPGEAMSFEDWSAALIAASDRAQAIDEETAGRCADLERKIAAMVKYVGDAHQQAKEPYLAAGRVVDSMKNAAIAPLAAAKLAVNAKSTKFLREETARREAEAKRQREIAEEAARVERVRLAKLAEEQAAANADAERDVFGLLPIAEPEPVYVEPIVVAAPVQVRSEEGASLGGTRVWTGTVTDYTLAFMAVEKNSKVREAIDKAIQSLVKGGLHEIAGVAVSSQLQARAR